MSNNRVVSAPTYVRPPRIIQRFINAKLEGEAVLLQTAMTQLARGEDIVLSPRMGTLMTQAHRRSGPFAPVPPRPVRLGLHRPAIG